MFMQQMQQMMMMFTGYGPPSFPYPPVSIAISLGQPSTPMQTPRQGQLSQSSDDCLDLSIVLLLSIWLH